jgi:hypothetical protein
MRFVILLGAGLSETERKLDRLMFARRGHQHAIRTSAVLSQTMCSATAALTSSARGMVATTAFWCRIDGR